MSFVKLIITAALASLAAAPAVLAQPFSYQGRLTSSGTNAATPHDFEFRVFNDVIGGAQIGTTTTRLNVPLSDGTFTTTIDPGQGVFTGAARWVQISVRPTGSPAAFSVLTPRQRVDAAPYSIRSLSERWTDQGLGVLANDAAVQRVFINRSTPITGAEYFGITTPTGEGQFGGMYVNTASGTGLPFYGYATAGSLRAYHYLDTERTWILYNNGPRLIVAENGAVGIGTSAIAGTALSVGGSVAVTGSVAATNNITTTADVSASNFRFNSPKTRYADISAASLQPTDAAGRAVMNVGVGSIYHQSASLHRVVGGVELPAGATIVSLKIFAVDNATANMTARLHNYVMPNNFSYVVASASSSGASLFSREFSTAASSFPPVDLSSRTWSLEVDLPSVGPGEFLAFNGAIVEYTVPAAD